MAFTSLLLPRVDMFCLKKKYKKLNWTAYLSSKVSLNTSLVLTITHMRVRPLYSLGNGFIFWRKTITTTTTTKRTSLYSMQKLNFHGPTVFYLVVDKKKIISNWHNKHGVNWRHCMIFTKSGDRKSQGSSFAGIGWISTK